LERVMSGMDRVFVILPWKRDLPAMMSSVIRTAKRCKTGFILKMSSICANMNSQHKPQIMRDHGECDEMLASSGLPFAIIQPQILFDNLLKFQGDIIKHDRSWYGLGGGSAACIDARDVADCVVSILLNPSRFLSRRLVLTGKEAVSGEMVAVGMSRIYQKSIAYKTVSESELRSVLTRRQIPGFMQDDLIGIELMIRDGLLKDQVTYTVKEVCGHPPRTMETFLASYRSQLCPSFSLKQMLHFFI